jgi:hypothetical protein
LRAELTARVAEVFAEWQELANAELAEAAKTVAAEAGCDADELRINLCDVRIEFEATRYDASKAVDVRVR